MPSTDVQPQVTLRTFGREDFERLISWVPTEADMIPWCGAFFGFPLDAAQLERYAQSAERPRSRVIFTAEFAGDPVGHVEISQIAPHLSSRLSRVLVAPEHRRRRVGSMMLAQAIDFTFDHYHVDRIDLGVWTANSSAMECYRKLGFAHVGTWPNAMVADTHTIDVYWMTLTRVGWRSARPYRCHLCSRSAAPRANLASTAE